MMLIQFSIYKLCIATKTIVRFMASTFKCTDMCAFVFCAIKDFVRREYTAGNGYKHSNSMEWAILFMVMASYSSRV